jgi:hypothetical protein
MIAFFTGSLPGSFVTRPLTVARAGAADEDIGKLCAESAEATTSHNKAARGNFILLFGCGEEFQSRPNLTARIDQILTSYSNPVSARIQIKKICGFGTVKYLESTTYVLAVWVNHWKQRIYR